MKRFISIFLGLWIFTACAQDITRLEYFIDTDPGYGNATNIPITPDPLVSTNFTLATTGISYGLHYLFVRAEDADGKWSESSLVPVIIGEFSNPGNLVQMEYFIDNDPGYGMATQRTVTPGNNISQMFDLDVSGLGNGLHHFFLRVKDENGLWSVVQHTVFFTEDLSVGDIVKLEYFLDNDPGYGAGINIPVIGGKDVSKTFIIDLTGISQGIHQLCIRAKNSENRWSLVHTSPILAVDPSIPDIVQIEYFFDSDPGFGAGIQIPISPGQNISEVLTMDTTGLSTGRHFLFVRAKNTRNNWSVVGYQDFLIFKTKLFLEGLYSTEAHEMRKTQESDGDITWDKWPGTTSDTLSVLLAECPSGFGTYFREYHGVNINTDGTVAVNVPIAVTGDYYIVIKHRSSVETWSANLVSFGGEGPFIYDFTDDQAKACGNNLFEVEPGVWAIYCGDVTSTTEYIQDGYVDLSDVQLVNNANTSFLFGYLVEDVNGDGFVDLSDVQLVNNNNTRFAGVIYPCW
jgi:hypothetical protein